MTRLFTAIELTPEAREAVSAEQRRLSRLLSGAAMRWASPAQMHITLVFLGSVDVPTGAAITAAMQGILTAPVFALTVGGLGIFPPHGAPRVLFLGITEGLEPMRRLSREVGERLGGAGVAPVETRAYHPHLTLGRWRQSRPADRRRMPAENRAVATMSVRAVTLFESRLSPAGSAYTALAHAPLQCPLPSSPAT